MLVAVDIYHGSEPEARIMYAIITGMGFIGGGAIFKGDNTVKGTATAASLWNTATIGISVAYGRYEITVILSVVNFLILLFSEPFKAKDKRESLLYLVPISRLTFILYIRLTEYKE